MKFGFYFIFIVTFLGKICVSQDPSGDSNVSFLQKFFGKGAVTPNGAAPEKFSWKNVPEINIGRKIFSNAKDEQYPVTISCLTEFKKENPGPLNKVPFKFVTAKSNNKDQLDELYNKLNNGRNLTIYVLGTAVSVNDFARHPTTFYSVHTPRWFKRVNRNICYVEYTFEDQPISAFEFLKYVNRIIQGKRHETTAEVIRDLVVGVRDKSCKNRKKVLESWDDLKGSEVDLEFELSHVHIIGFSLGAQIGALACRLLAEIAIALAWKILIVPWLTALDPAGIPYHWSVKCIGKDDADFVEVIHTSIMGTITKNGDFDVFVNVLDESDDIEKHSFATHLHMAACTGEYIVIASRKGKEEGRRGRILSKLPVGETLKLVPDEREVFMHSKSTRDPELPSIVQRDFRLECSRTEIVRYM